MTHNLPRQRWKFYPSQPHIVTDIVKHFGVSPIMAQVIANRGIDDIDSAQAYITPETVNLPSPLAEFPDLPHSIQLLKDAIASGAKIAICGDYDADGMTSTALLIRALKHLEAKVDYAIPSRMKDGYGINERIVEEFKQEGVSLILTVDNGISAYNPIKRAKELGLKVIITDHHDLPEKLPPADAILNPKLLPETSPYYGLAGVGVAYVLGVCLAQSLGKLDGLTKSLLELYTIGTIADLAPLTGVNRRWLKRGLKLLPKSDILGIQALSKCAGLTEEKKQLHSDDIGFKLGPRVNAIGRLDDPQIVIELFTTDDEQIAITKALQCEQTNHTRQELCKQIEKEAIEIIETKPIKWQEDRVLLIINNHWHHGVIGIVASRLVERYGVPVFIGTYEDEDPSIIRGSARGIEEYNIFSALQYCDDLLKKYGGHKAAGGFSFEAKNLDLIHQRLKEFSYQCLLPEYLKPLIKIDTQITFEQITFKLLQEIESLYPWGIENKAPIFWTPQVEIKSERITKTGEHLQLFISDGTRELKAIAWRWAVYSPLPKIVDIAYKLKENEWQGEKSIQLELVGIRQNL
ncbi:single-stranded-DNA-specific exonuclease RecJ [Cyanobacterium aponinum]|uniref:single-stranded-DNA-specific exonuclease RecJ n=1 Tax=Cyanobacterium aponinum TaxID=379064 RepID=UPI000C129DCB|nr:single-stranded-DNA-specific exonuclease RecJ [Cyanobacterium aponinum]PHV64350.1 single-stranded-DNA-specific exonuclease RecJ [Cyanobacterium aponinum IPPAS B-1201]